MKFLEQYHPWIRMESTSVLAGKSVAMMDHDDEHFDDPILKAWMADNDVRQIRLINTCMGYVRMYDKLPIDMPIYKFVTQSGVTQVVPANDIKQALEICEKDYPEIWADKPHVTERYEEQES